MVTHDFSAPIPAGTLRISVICNDHLHRTDLLMVKVPDTIRAFEEFIGIILSAEDGRCTPEAAKVCTEVRRHAGIIETFWCHVSGVDFDHRW